MYAISFRLKLLVLNLRIVKMANKPNPMPIAISTPFRIKHIKKTIIPIKKRVNKNFPFLEYLK